MPNSRACCIEGKYYVFLHRRVTGGVSKLGLGPSFRLWLLDMPQVVVCPLAIHGHSPNVSIRVVIPLSVKPEDKLRIFPLNFREPSALFCREAIELDRCFHGPRFWFAHRIQGLG